MSFSWWCADDPEGSMAAVGLAKLCLGWVTVTVFHGPPPAVASEHRRPSKGLVCSVVLFDGMDAGQGEWVML